MNVVILEAGDEPNSDENIYKTCQAYYKDLGLTDKDNLDIWADQAIYSRLLRIKSNEENSYKLRLGLGQWHTSKAMCSALITLFSSYGIYNCALELGAKYLEKLEDNIDYRSTCNVLETIWASTGFAIHHYLIKKKLEEEGIMEGETTWLKSGISFTSGLAFGRDIKWTLSYNWG